MKLPRREFLHLAVGAAVLVISLVLIVITGEQAWSQTARTMKIIVPYAPGGGGSVLARVLGEQFERTPNVTLLVENRAGGGSVVGTEAVARSAPDGNTLLITNPAIIINPHLRKQNYDPLTSFQPVCKLVQTADFIVVNSTSPYRTLTDLLNAARAKPGELTMATVVGSAGHIGLEALKRMASVDITFVPFAGSAPGVTALLGGHVTALFDNYATVAEHVKADKLRLLAATARKRPEALADIPTVSETTNKDYDFDGWWGMFAPARTPREALDQLASWAVAALQEPAARQKLEPLGFYPAITCGADFAAFLREQNNEYSRVIREANIKAD